MSVAFSHIRRQSLAQCYMYCSLLTSSSPLAGARCYYCERVYCRKPKMFSLAGASYHCHGVVLVDYFSTILLCQLSSYWFVKDAKSNCRKLSVFRSSAFPVRRHCRDITQFNKNLSSPTWQQGLVVNLQVSRVDLHPYLQHTHVPKGTSEYEYSHKFVCIVEV